MICIVCDKPLSGKLDTFGLQGNEQCWEDWIDNGDEPEGGADDFMYGLGPHQHLTDSEGNIIIGGTQFYKLPEPGPDGLIYVDGLPGAFMPYFRPDPESPGCGMWFRHWDAVRRWDRVLREQIEGV